MVKLKKIITIAGKEVGEGCKTFIIAEAGINHNGDIEVAKKHIDEAKKCGADAVKFQTYITEQRVAKDSPIFDILKKCEFDSVQTKELFDYAKKVGITFFSAPFDEDSASVLIDMGVPLIKMTSFHVTHLKLVEKVAKAKIPVVMSRGMSNIEEIKKAISIFDKYDCPYCLMHCVSSYPLKEENANISIVKTMNKEFDCPVGYSDHTKGNRVAALAVAAGATIIEKHFIHDKDFDGADKPISADPKQMKELVDEIRLVEKVMGDSEIRQLECEKDILQYRKKSE